MVPVEVGIFLSYAHYDDLKTTASEDEVGFVTFLHKMLRVKLLELGATKAKLWLDTQRVAQGDLYDDQIIEGLRHAELLVVVMSKNWMQRPYCRRELEAFGELRRNTGVNNIPGRLVVVGKDHVDRIKRPFDLQGQEGFLFYARDETNTVSHETPFFNRGKANSLFYDRRDELATYLQKRIDHIVEGTDRDVVRAVRARPNGRTIYLSKPATDMKAPYARLTTELQGRGFMVVPDVIADLPSDFSARSVVWEALGRAEATIHLLGNKPGFAPENLDPIVRLQLALAREEAAARANQQGVFRRIVWAPKALDSGDLDAEPEQNRDPLVTLERFDRKIASDIVDGDVLSKFVQYLFQCLAETKLKPAQTAELNNGKIEIYVVYHEADEEISQAFATALDGIVKMFLPVPECGSEGRRFNRDKLTKCDGLFVYWGNAPEVWVRSEAEKIANWQSLGRMKEFALRRLIAGPPSTAHKDPKVMALMFQGQFESYELIDKPLTRELLANFISGSKP